MVHMNNFYEISLQINDQNIEFLTKNQFFDDIDESNYINKYGICFQSSKKTNVNIPWERRTQVPVSRTACGPQHIFTFVILSVIFVLKRRTCDLNASEFIGNPWQNAHDSKSVKCERDQNEQKVKKFKSIWNSC